MKCKLGKCDNLIAEMARNGVTRNDIGLVCGISESSTNNKIVGRCDFLLSEGVAIHNRFFSSLDFKYLFARN